MKLTFESNLQSQQVNKKLFKNCSYAFFARRASISIEKTTSKTGLSVRT